MFRIVLLLLSSYFLVACGGIGFSLGEKPITDYQTLKASQKEKYASYSCNFDNIVKDNFTNYGDFCGKIDYADYVSYFVSFDYQKFPFLRDDYIKNLHYQLKVNSLDNERKFLESIMNDNITPKSFVTSSGKNTAIFLSRQDVVLRSIIYPMLYVNGLVEPDNATEKLLSDYKIRYTVHPYIIDAEYSTDDIAKMLGVPLYSTSEYNIDATIKTVDDTKGLRVDNESNAYLNQYLPPYELSSVEIYYGSNLLKKYQREDIIDVIFNEDETAGLFLSHVSSIGSQYIIRFNYVPMKPKYEEVTKIRIATSGISTIYSMLGNTLSTDLKVEKPHDTFSIPFDCLKKAKVDRFLEGVGLNKEEQFKVISKFNRKAQGCSANELFLTNVIFGPRYDEFKEILNK